MSESSKTISFDVERLQQLSYERSTKWANFLDSIAVSENQDVINIDDFEKLYDEDLEDQDELASMEDESCDDKSLDSGVLRDISNSTRLALMLSSHNKTSKLSDTTIISDENHELVDLFNQTMPVINEHNRQMKESGFDRILNTFDAKKIEEKVGGWLRRHNSLCTPDYTAPKRVNQKENPYKAQQQIAAYRPTAATSYIGCRNDDTDSDDSFHSGETARYIRSSRAGALKNSSSTTMMIKTYRMVKSTRQALKDKYACAHDDDAELHLNKLRHRRRVVNEVEILHSKGKHSMRTHKPKNQYTTPSHALQTIQKRKVLRKRSVSNSCSAMDTSSDSDHAYNRGYADEYYHRRHKCCGQRHRFTRRRHAAISSDAAASVKRSQNRPTRRIPCSRRDYMYCYEQTHSHSVSSSSSLSSSASFTGTCKKGGRKCMNKQMYKDFRPYKLESECRCCNEKRVCQEYTHLADTSTDEWFVENSYTSKNLLNTKPPSEQMLCNIMDKQQCSITDITAIADNAPILSTKNHKAVSPATAVLDLPAKKCSKTSTKQTRKKTEKPKEELDDSFEIELQSALKASKDLYEREQKEMAKTNHGKAETKRETLPTKPLAKTYKDAAVVGKLQLKRQLTEDALTPIDEVCQKSCKLKDSAEDKKVFLKPLTNWNSSIKNRNATIDGSEDTFFAVSPRVCNSTALPNDKTAGKRQIDEDSELVKETNKKRAAMKVREVLRKTTSALDYGEENDKGTMNSLKDTPNINENYTPVRFRTTKLSKKPSTEINANEEKLEQNVDTPRPKKKITTKKISPKEEIIDNSGYSFVKPRGRPKKISKAKSDTKPEMDTTYFSVSQVNINSTAEVNVKFEFDEQTINRNEDTAKSNKRKQEIKIMPAEKDYEEEKNDANQKADNNSQDLYTENSKNVTSLAKVRKLKPNVSIKSNLCFEKSIERDDILNVSITMPNKDPEGKKENSSFAKEQSALVSEAPSRSYSEHSSSTRVKFKDDSQKQMIGYISLSDSEDGNNTDLTPCVRQKNRQSMSRTKKINNSNVSSTTIHLPGVSKNLRKTKMPRKHIIIDDTTSSLGSEDENDCTVVSSTTNVEPHIPPSDDTRAKAQTTSSSTQNETSSSSSHLASTTQNRSCSHHPKKGILIYTPKNPSLAPAQSFSNDGCFFHITKEHLSSVIGEKPAEKFLKYYIGRRRFNKNSTIYFKPPAARVLATNDASSSDSDTDDLESMGQYGDLYESVGGAGGGSNNETDNCTTQHS